MKACADLLQPLYLILTWMKKLLYPVSLCHFLWYQILSKIPPSQNWDGSASFQHCLQCLHSTYEFFNFKFHDQDVSVICINQALHVVEPDIKAHNKKLPTHKSKPRRGIKAFRHTLDLYFIWNLPICNTHVFSISAIIDVVCFMTYFGWRPSHSGNFFWYCVQAYVFVLEVNTFALWAVIEFNHKSTQIPEITIRDLEMILAHSENWTKDMTSRALQCNVSGFQCISNFKHLMEDGYTIGICCIVCCLKFYCRGPWTVAHRQKVNY